jgi:hypothetical protein
MGRARRSEACRSRVEEGAGEGRREEKEKEKKKEKMGKEKEKGKKEKGKEREREIHAALIAVSVAGPVDRVQRSHVRADEATGKGVGVLEIGQLEQRKILGNRV